MNPITNDQELASTIKRMKDAGTDLADLELKAAAGGFPKSTAETISAFSNTKGGTLIFGISEKDFAPIAGLDVKAIQSKCAQTARELLEPPVQADINVLRFKSHPVVVANIPEMSSRQKPCHIKKYGQLNGSYIRTGDGDHKMTLYEIDRFIENQQHSARNDAVIVPESTLADLDKNLLEGWLAYSRVSSLGRGDTMTDEGLLTNRRVAVVDEEGTIRLTVAGLMALGKYPQKYFPRLNIVFTSYPIARKGELDKTGKRFTDTANIDGPIPEMLLGALNVISRNMKHGAIVKGSLREDVPDYPMPVLREVIANALMHRDYSLEAQAQPVMIDLFPDRIEIANPGGLYGALTIEKLGKGGGTVSRNQFLARILEDVPYRDYDGVQGRIVENRGSGYPTIQNELEKALMSKPIIISSLDEFRFTLLHRKMAEYEDSAYSKSNMEDAIFAYFVSHESASTAEISKAAGISSKTAMNYLNKLLEDGVIEGIGSKYSPKRRYRLFRG